MGRYLLSLKRFWGTALAGQLEYQANMLIDLLAMVGSLAGSIFVLSVFFGQGRDLGGWSWEAALVVQGIYTLNKQTWKFQFLQQLNLAFGIVEYGILAICLVIVILI